MRNKIRLYFPDAYITSRSVPNIYIADFSERTQKARGIEIHNIQPVCPINKDKQMDCVVMYNPGPLEIDFNIFDDHQFKDEQGKDITHCECCIYPSDNHEKSWVIMLEIKDCKPKNISNYKNEVIEQIASTTNIFRNKNIISTHKVYGIISFPRSKISFNNTIFGMPPEYKRLKTNYGILFAASNNIKIISDTHIKCLE